MLPLHLPPPADSYYLPLHHLHQPPPAHMSFPPAPPLSTLACLYFLQLRRGDKEEDGPRHPLRGAEEVETPTEICTGPEMEGAGGDVAWPLGPPSPFPAPFCPMCVSSSSPLTFSGPSASSSPAEARVERMVFAIHFTGPEEAEGPIETTKGQESEGSRAAEIRTAAYSERRPPPVLVPIRP